MLGAGGRGSHRPDVVDVAGRVDGLIAFAGAAPPESLTRIAPQATLPPLIPAGPDGDRQESRIWGSGADRWSNRSDETPIE